MILSNTYISKVVIFWTGYVGTCTYILYIFISEFCREACQFPHLANICSNNCTIRYMYMCTIIQSFFIQSFSTFLFKPEMLLHTVGTGANNNSYSWDSHSPSNDDNSCSWDSHSSSNDNSCSGYSHFSCTIENSLICLLFVNTLVCSERAAILADFAAEINRTHIGWMVYVQGFHVLHHMTLLQPGVPTVQARPHLFNLNHFSHWQKVTVPRGTYLMFFNLKGLHTVRDFWPWGFSWICKIPKYRTSIVLVTQ